MSPSPIHRPPTRPHRWWGWLLACQLGVAFVCWRFGWRVGLPLMALSHLPFWWGALWPYSRFYGPVLNRLPGAAPRVWLTIDDGPSDDTLPMLDLLDAHGAKATFFLVARRAAARPECVSEIVRRGHDIGNHSDSHPARWFWALGPRAMRREIAEAQATLTRLAGRAPRWFRAVVGMANPFVQAPLREHGLARVAWSARGFDGLGRDVETVMAKLAPGVRTGAIVLLHEGGDGRHIEILRRVLALLGERGLRAELPE
ncbi:polysaccharide deacetylase family protein [Lysobacter pythonis]|uniref:Polysaccharide deacetylase family protein n=1 Tax=Solilutibacter pythonis TaxID=2483112 RepID=A0A3M2HZB8_9GAMM|nr:polysaccharide deacetylase family protein [Lysobacter pythonis]RMH93213.1 polysaccharide deacetylase family protein [Lysobacter pythonis]